MARFKSTDGPVMEKLLEHYELYARAAGFSQSQINNVRMCLGLFDRFLGGIEDIGEVATDDFRRFLADLRTRPAWQGLITEKQRNLSNSTINTYARTVKTFFKWLKDESIITENTLESVKTPPIGEKVSKAYSEEQMKVVLAASSLNTRDKAIFYSFIESGLRLDELCTLKIGGVDFQNSFAKVLGKGKGKKERYIYLAPYSVDAIDAYIKESRRDASNNDFVFVKGDGKPLTNSGIRSMLVRLGERLGLGVRLSPHRLRHTFATLSLRYGATREELQKEMGHSNPKTTEGYLHVPDSEIGAAHQRFSPLSNLMRGRIEKGPPETDAKNPSHQSQIGESQITKPGYSKKLHEQIRGLAEEIQSGIRLPWIKDSFIPELQPGRYSLGREKFPINITKEGKIQIAFSISDTDEKDLVTQALCSHLETSGLEDLSSGVSAWGDSVAEYLYYCHNLLNKVRSDIEETYGVSIAIDADDKPGFIIDFPILICADAVDQASGFEHFSSYKYGYDGLKLRFGGYVIYNGVSNEEFKRFEEAHRNLRSQWVKTKQTIVIAQKRMVLDGEAIAIHRKLQNFLAFENLPGYCPFCT
ncbi:tyrosine-type recombinase/integrase [Chloroflexota bacterium]